MLFEIMDSIFSSVKDCYVFLWFGKNVKALGEWSGVIFAVTNCTWFWVTASSFLSGTLVEYLEWNVDAVNIGRAKYKMAAVMLMAATE